MTMSIAAFFETNVRYLELGRFSTGMIRNYMDEKSFQTIFRQLFGYYISIPK